MSVAIHEQYVERKLEGLDYVMSLAPQDQGVRSAYDRFIEFFLQGLGTRDAAEASGLTRSSAYTVKRHPYVQAAIAYMREQMTQENICTRNELLLNVKSIAFDESEDARARIAASTLISKIGGYDAPIKTANLHVHQGGVMLVPVPANPDDWEAAAKHTQEALKQDVRT